MESTLFFSSDFKVTDFVLISALEFDGLNGDLVKTKIIWLKAIINEIKDNIALIEYFEDAQKIIGHKFKWVHLTELKPFINE